MKKGIILLALLLLLAGCSKKEAVPTSNNNAGVEDEKENASDHTDSKSGASGEKSEGFQFEYNGVTIPMNVDAAPIIEKLGEATEYFEAPSCAFQGLDKTYSYSGFDLTTYPSGDKDFVSTVYFQDDSVSTDKGIYLGSTLEDVTSAYGEDYTEESGGYTYSLGETTLSFLIEDDSVTSITYSALLLQN